MEAKEFDKNVESLAALQEPVRRALYRYVAAHNEPVTRDQAARAAGTSRSMAAFHLDKLVDAGLLAATFRRVSGRAGPGAGRTSKLYERAPTTFELSLPQRGYQLAAQVLAQALARTEGIGEEALRGAGLEWGRALAGELSIPRRGRPLRRAEQALARFGYEPEMTASGDLVLRNCPFDALRTQCRGLICGMNLALVRGLIAGLQLGEIEAELRPCDGFCCVVLRGAREVG